MIPDEKPFSQACEENKRVILEVTAPLFESARRLLEIGSGTGQHAAFFAAAMPHLTWQSSDISQHLPGIRRWIADAHRPNLPPPLELDVLHHWPTDTFDSSFSANTAHIMSMPAVAAMLTGVGHVLEPGGAFALYGPFNYDGQYTSQSNADFDVWLKRRDPRSGIKAFETVDTLARANGLAFEADHPMPANNRILVWRRTIDTSRGQA